MSTNNWRFVCNAIAGLLIPATLSFSTARAAEAVKWSDLPKKIGHGKMRSENREDREYRVVTKTGRTYTGHELIFSPNDVRVATASSGIPREQVAEIRVRRDRSVADAVMTPACAIFLGIVAPGSSDDWFPPNPVEVLLALPIALGALAVTVPVVLPIEGIRKLLPGKVYKVAP